ncbi:MAG: rocF [Gammaproteobacteria bacterium]|jgi:arginase|nr:rocF [Gammaproteobacteria bacterium]
MVNVYLLGAAWGLGAKHQGCAQGPFYLQESHLFLKQLKMNAPWQIISPDPAAGDVFDQVQEGCYRLSQLTSHCVTHQQPFVTIGGDHSCAIGTWYGALKALSPSTEMGLLWIDAHMDSHTLETSVSHRIHGMPLACLLGYGDKRLIHLNTSRVLNPKQVCLVGVRSFESGEALLLQRLGVRIFKMDEINSRGLKAVLSEAIAIVKQNNAAYGISVDLDAFDPLEVPGVGSPEEGGLDLKTCCDILLQCRYDPHLLGLEIAEYNPDFDKDNLTQTAIIDLIKSLF